MSSIMPNAYVVTLMYVAEDEQDGASEDVLVHAKNPSHALAKAIEKNGSVKYRMPFRSFAVFKVSQTPCLEDN